MIGSLSIGKLRFSMGGTFSHSFTNVVGPLSTPYEVHRLMNEAIYIHNFLISSHVGMLTLITNYLKECLNKMLCHALQSLLVILHMGMLKTCTNCLKECLNETMYDGIL
jgi:hypothetical protein